MTPELSPTARALLALEVIQNNPGITAQRLAARLGVSDRAARRYVAILREAELPIDSVSGPYGGYQVGRGLRLPPLTFTAAEGLGLVMAVLEGHRGAADPTDPVGEALAKIVRVLPERIAGLVRGVRDSTAAPAGVSATPSVPATAATDEARISSELATALIESCSAARRLRLAYRMGGGPDREMTVDPWAVILRHSRWYLLCWSHTRDARRVLRMDRIVSVQALPEPFEPPADLDALRVLEDHLSQGWTHQVDVLIDAEPARVARWLPRSMGRLSPEGAGRTRLLASTDEPDWYVGRLAAVEAPFRVLGSAELRKAAAALGQRLIEASGD